MNKKNLGIYLNDHLAGSIAGIELAKRSAGSNKGNEFGNFLEELAAEFEDDQVSLQKLMEDLGIRKDILKDAAAWLGEKVGRLKLNGQLVGYSELSRVIELEGLYLGVHGKLSLWSNLKHLSLPEVSATGIDLDELIGRAKSQIGRIEDCRGKAVTRAFAPSAASPA